MNRNRIIQTAIALFAVYGIKAVDISRIAKETHISEQTVDAEFSSMEQLLEACVQHEIEVLETDVSDAILQSHSSLELLVDVISTVFAGLSRFCTAFYCDLGEFPLVQKQMILFRNKFHNNCIGYFIECEKDGFFSSDFFSMESSASFCIETFVNMEYKYQAKIIRIFLQSISTKKGIREINRIDRERNIFIYN